MMRRYHLMSQGPRSSSMLPLFDMCINRYKHHTEDSIDVLLQDVMALLTLHIRIMAFYLSICYAIT